MQCRRRRLAPPLSALARRCQVPESPPPPKSLGGLQEGIGAGSAAGIGEAAGLGAERRFGAALRADFFLVDFFADAFVVFRFLRAGAAFFFFLVDRFFALVLFAIMDLPIRVRFKTRAFSTPCPASNARYDTPHPSLGQVLSQQFCSAGSRRQVHRRIRRRLRAMLPQRRRTGPASSPVDQLDRMDRRKLRARCDLNDATEIAGCDHIWSQSLDSPDFTLAQPPCDVRLQNIVGPCRTAT